MHRFKRFLLLLPIFSNAISAQQPDNTRALPPAQWARPHNTDVKHLALDLRFDWPKKQAFGTAAVTFLLIRPADKIALDAGMLDIHSVSWADGKPLKFAYDGGDKNEGLEVFLGRVCPPGEDFTIKITYRTRRPNLSDPNSLGGSNGKGIRFFEPTSTDPLKRRQIWSMGEPESNRYWFPCYDAPNDFRTSELTATVDKNMTVVSNGRLLENRVNADGTHTFHWKTELPHANHQTSLVVGEFVDIQQYYKGIPLHSYGYPDEAEAVAASVVRLPDMVGYFSEKTGVPYPFPCYAQAFVQDLPNAAANAGASTITENMVDDSSTHAEFLYLWDLTQGEALAQQWFGNYVSCGDWSDVWLNKAFGRFLSGLYTGYKNGREEFLLYQLAFDQNASLNDWNAGIRQPVVTKHYGDVLAFTSGNLPYFRGASALHALYKHLGEEVWWKAVGIYLNSNAGKPVSTEDFRKAVEAASGEPMDWFFDQWLYKTGHPVFEISKSYDAAKKQLTLVVRQTQKPDPNETYPQTAFFQGKIDIEIDERIERVWLAPKPENVFVFDAAQQPKLVQFDVESAWLKEVIFEKPLDELIFQFQNDRDILGKRWAMGELAKSAQNKNTSEADKLKIYDAFRAVILGKAYWRLRYNAMRQIQGLLAPAGQTTPAALDEATVSALLTVIKNDKMWNRAAAINFLGMTQDAKFADLYLQALGDKADRVVNAAAIALGRSKSPRAFAALENLVKRPSWKNQSLISALNGLKELGDPRGYDLAFTALSELRSPHWTLATPVWDYRLAAAQTIAALGKSDAAWPFALSAFNKAAAENDLHGIFYNALICATLGDPRGQEIFDALKMKYKNDANAMTAVGVLEAQFQEAIKKAGR